MKIISNQSLKLLNTFGIQATARYFLSVDNLETLKSFRENEIWRSEMLLILGGGSNILFTKDFSGLIIQSKLNGIEFIDQSDSHVYVKAASGETWHDLVRTCVDKNLGGLENLALIPGLCGAAPIQNIGAYGTELSDVIVEVEGIDLRNGKHTILKAADCQFGYRESIFKHDFEKKIFISSITLRLTKENHLINHAYGALDAYLKKKNINNPSITDVYDSVIAIRSEKLPDPKVFGNVGSFFKNPVVDAITFKRLQSSFPTIPFYHSDNQQFKIPAGWLIEQAGWKGKRNGQVGVHHLQALVIINFGGASGQEIFDFSEQIIEDVLIKFEIKLQREVNVIG
jgi:UDP-N-acetylmuramate dehydrogenase